MALKTALSKCFSPFFSKSSSLWASAWDNNPAKVRKRIVENNILYIVSHTSSIFGVSFQGKSAFAQFIFQYQISLFDVKPINPSGAA
jgi:hypothetical protein